ncbi:hypothetical protein GALMADRAFT_877776 [Galerina marginata CBS 339.88]|uniref:Uncharacterized protein n=1 Tax=Galerina marginata (strain CBS 339.88) TaxID=685588 RepID=A0A067SUU7_GALM3|nr:hypothetical protein GALMADRAFT_877776 [Galerina marginata CBS 339.88]
MCSVHGCHDPGHSLVHIHMWVGASEDWSYKPALPCFYGLSGLGFSDCILVCPTMVPTFTLFCSIFVFMFVLGIFLAVLSFFLGFLLFWLVFQRPRLFGFDHLVIITAVASAVLFYAMSRAPFFTRIHWLITSSFCTFMPH